MTNEACDPYARTTGVTGQTVNYASCHDGHTLYDRLFLSTNASIQNLIRMNNLSAAIIMTSQGVPFIQAGEEMLRSKPLEEGGFEHNSYNSPIP